MTHNVSEVMFTIASLEDVLCPCGNTVSGGGFFSAVVTGDTTAVWVEPTVEDWDAMHVGCAECGRVAPVYGASPCSAPSGYTHGAFVVPNVRIDLTTDR